MEGEEGEGKECKRSRMSDSTGKSEVNPLLIDLVLETIFPYCKLLSSDNWISVSDYRLVCKVWNKQLVKLIRQDVLISITNLITPYPDGLGWTENADKENGFHYQCPYPVESSFENVMVAGTCENLTQEKVIRWFKIMGGTVKQLRFTSPLSCYHQTRFLECVLKLWCRNLKTLHLNGIECLYSLIHNSKFVTTSGLICDLEHVNISLVEGDDMETLAQFKNCQEEDLTATYLNFSNGAAHKLLPDDPAHRTFKLQMLKRLSRDFRAEVTQESLDFIINTTGTDGGALGQIFKTSQIEKFSIGNMSVSQCQDFLAFLNFRSIRMKDTLKHFEYDNFPLAVSALHFDAFRMLKFPLTTIKFGLLFAFEIVNSIRDLLASYADTLEHLEFTGNVVLQDWVTEQEEEFLEIVLPPLPKLKRFINSNIFTCRMGGFDFLKNMPNLEKCELANTIYHSSIYPLTPAEVFNMLFQAGYLETPHPLKELLLDGKICYSNHVDMMPTWFPELKKVDLILDGADVFVDFLRVAKNLKMEDIKLSFNANDNEWCNAGIVNNIGRMTNLKFLQLNHLPDSPLTISAKTCEDGFAKAPNLTSLKLTNFGMFADEVVKIRSILSHISCVKFYKTTLQYKPVDLDFSLGVEDRGSIPF